MVELVGWVERSEVQHFSNQNQNRRGQPDSWILSFASPKESIQRKGDPAVSPFGFLRSDNKIGRLRNSHDLLRSHVLKQSSPFPQFYRPPSAIQKGVESQNQTPKQNLNPGVRLAHTKIQNQNLEGATRSQTTPCLTLGPHIRHRVAQASQGILTNMFEHVDAQRIVRVYLSTYIKIRFSVNKRE